MGTCIFEGTNCSEGRGTTLPFQVIGAPFLNGAELEKRLADLETPGIRFRRTSFCPTFSKHQGELCHGVQMHIIDREHCDAVAAGLLLCDTIRSMAGEQLSFIQWPGEKSFAFDRLLGTTAYREGRLTALQLNARAQEEAARFQEETKKYRLYR